MKRIIPFLLSILWICLMGIVSYAESTFTITADTAIAGQEYVLIIVGGEKNALKLVDNDDSILFIQQKKATSSTLSFQDVKPAEFEKATAFMISEEGVLVKCMLLEDIPETVITLPSNIEVIEEEAFEGISALAVRIPNGVNIIKTKAFANCPNLRRIYIPKTVNLIEDDAFTNSPSIVIFGYNGSVAEQYAEQNEIRFVKID